MTRHAQDIDHFVGQRVAQLRHSLGLSQTALADRLGVSFQQVQKYEKGANRISASRLFQLTQVLGCSLSSLFPPRSDRDPTAPLEDPSLYSPEATALLSAFCAIEDKSLRRALSQIAVALAKA